MNHCPVCGRPASGPAFALCSECRSQIISLRPADKRYFWYVRAIRRALLSC